MEYANFVVRSAVAVVFLLAAAGKARNIGVFEKTLSELSVPSSLQALAAWTLVGIEIAIGLAILSNSNAALVGIIATCLVALFVAVSVWAQRTAKEIPCACFGRSQTRLGKPTLARLILLEIAILAYCATAFFAGPHTWWPRDVVALVPSVAAATALVILGRWALAAPTLIGLRRARGRTGA